MTTEITLKDATTIVDAVLDEGEKLGCRPLTAAVLDAAGHVKLLKRADGATFFGSEVCVAKAWSALALGRPSRQLGEMMSASPGVVASLSALGPSRFLPVPGGVLAYGADGQLVGAVGVTGDTADNDEKCALSGVQAAGFKSDAN